MDSIQVNDKLKQIKLPTINMMEKMTDKKFKNILSEFNIKNISELNLFKRLVENRIVDLYKKTVIQSAIDFNDGKYENIKEVPMYRKDGIIYNIPDNIQRWCHFYGLIEKFEKVELF